MPQPIEFTDDDPIRAPDRESRMVRINYRLWLGHRVRTKNRHSIGRVVRSKNYPAWIYEPSVAGHIHTCAELRAIADFLDQQNAALKMWCELERRAKRKPVRRRMSAQRIRRSPKPKRKR